MNPAARHELQTLRDLIRYGACLGGPDAACAALAAGHAGSFLDARVLAEERERVLDLIDRRVTERVPAAYLTNEAGCAATASMWTRASSCRARPSPNCWTRA